MLQLDYKDDATEKAASERGDSIAYTQLRDTSVATYSNHKTITVHTTSVPTSYLAVSLRMDILTHNFFLYPNLLSVCASWALYHTQRQQKQYPANRIQIYKISSNNT